MMEEQIYDPKAERDKMGVDQNQLLSPVQPRPIVHAGSLLDCLTHTEVFSPEECAKIIADHSPDEWLEAGMNMSDRKEKKHIDHDYRHTHNAWIMADEKSMWLFDKMLALVMSANQHKWQFEIDFFEAIQLAKYEEGMHYDWHYDLGPERAGNRKLSVSVQLSAPEDYEGGELLLDIARKSSYTAPDEVGSVTVFPSFLKHKVLPVTKGTRYSLVVWASGTNRLR